MAEHDELLAEVLAMVVNGDKSARERLSHDPALQARLDELLGTTGVVADAELERREVLAAAQEMRAPLAEERLEAWVRARADRDQVAGAVLGSERFPWRPLVFAMAAVLLAIFSLGRWSPDAVPDQGSAPRYMGPDTVGDASLAPQGDVPAWTHFTWDVPLAEHEYFRVLVYDADRDDLPIAESRHLDKNRWTIDPTVGATWPARIRWELELYAEGGGYLDGWSAEASLSR